MVLNKKGQGLSLNVIIVAALALIVLVILVVVFTGRIGIFERGVSDTGSAELAALRVQYDQCRPLAAEESSFSRTFSAAESETEKEQIRADYVAEIGRCSQQSNDRTLCENAGCLWQ